MPKKTKDEKALVASKKAEVLAVYNSGGDWKSLIAKYNISKSSAYRLFKSQSSKDNRGGPFNLKFNQEHTDFIIMSIEKNPKITLSHNYFVILDEIKQFFLKRFKISIGKSTYCGY